MKLLKDLLVNSYSEDYSRIVSVIVDYLKENTNAKISLQNISKNKTNIIAIFGNPKSVINCHMDTVQPYGNWKYPPTDLIQEGDKIFGLGTTDTKGNIYCLLKAVKQVKPKNLALLFSIDEELSVKTGVAYFLESEYSKQIKQAIVCEPTSLQFVNKHKGYAEYEIEFKTKSGHSSINEENAITQAAKVLIRLKDYNIGKIQGGKQGNIIASNCKVIISKRSYETQEQILEELTQLVDKAKITLMKYSPPLTLTSTFVGNNFQEADFWTEAALFAQNGIKSLVFGTGNIKQAHTLNEFILKSDIKKGIEEFKKIIKQLEDNQ